MVPLILYSNVDMRCWISTYYTVVYMIGNDFSQKILEIRWEQIIALECGEIDLQD